MSASLLYEQATAILGEKVQAFKKPALSRFAVCEGWSKLNQLLHEGTQDK